MTQSQPGETPVYVCACVCANMLFGMLEFRNLILLTNHLKLVTNHIVPHHKC